MGAGLLFSALTPRQEKVVLEGNRAQRKGESVTGRGNGPNRN